MTILSLEHVDKLIEFESQIHYSESPPVNASPFVVINRNSPILLSAPHGCPTYRNRNGETWHEEDEYTAGMALFLSELCQVSVIATIWQTNDSDPNDTKENDERESRSSPYKKAVRNLSEKGIRWVIDLHGAKQNSERMAPSQLVDLGIGVKGRLLTENSLNQLRKSIERQLGEGAYDRKDYPGWDANTRGRSITAFVQQELGINAVQIEMKPSVRVARRRVDATMYGKPLSDGGGPYAAPAKQVLGMMQSLVDFVEYLNHAE